MPTSEVLRDFLHLNVTDADYLLADARLREPWPEMREAIAVYCAACRKFEEMALNNECPGGYMMEGPLLLIAEVMREEMVLPVPRGPDELFAERKARIKSQSSKSAIPPDLRWEVFLRDGFKCKHCGVQRNLSADHVVPESKGGPTTFENLQTLCRSCNSRKGKRFPTFPQGFAQPEAAALKGEE